MRYYLGNVYLGRVLLAAGLDALALGAAAWLVLLGGLAPSPLPYGLAVTAGLPLLLGLLYYTGSYDLQTLVQARPTHQALLVTGGLLAGLGLAAHMLGLLAPRQLAWIAPLLGLHLAGSALARVGLRQLFARGLLVERVLLIGVSELSSAIARAVTRRERLGIHVVGFLSDDPVWFARSVEGLPILGRVHEIEKVIEQVRPRRIVVASKQRDEYFPAEELLSAKLYGVKIESGVSFYERVTGRIYMRDLRPSYLIFSTGLTPRRVYLSGKRALDVALAAIGLVATLPFLLLAMLAVKLDSPGPVFFGQERLGQWGQTFRLWKLRSMIDDAEGTSGAVMTAHDGDERITRVGLLLRRSRLDEIPQLWNVLRGEMSLVGPRPERPEFAPALSDRYAYFQLRCAPRPGLTGWAQIRQGYVSDELAFEEKLALDLYYLKYRSLLMDLVILAKTAKTVLFLRGM